MGYVLGVSVFIHFLAMIFASNCFHSKSKHRPTRLQPAIGF